MSERRERDGFTHMLYFVWGPLILLIAGILIGFLCGVGLGVLALVSDGGTFLVIFGNLAYIGLVHSKRRWPGVPLSTRMVRTLTFWSER